MVKQALYVFKFEVQVFPKFHIYMISYKIYKNYMYEKSLCCQLILIYLLITKWVWHQIREFVRVFHAKFSVL